MKIDCCLNCTERSVGCHGKCTKYIEQRKRLDEVNKKKNNMLVTEHEYLSYHEYLSKKLGRKPVNKTYSYR